MEKITDYKVVSARNSEEITSKVKESLKEGWTPLGPAFLIVGSNDYAGETDPRLQTVLAQTLIKH